MPVVHPLRANEQAAVRRACEAVYPAGSWSLVHAMEVTLPMGNRSSLIGVTALDPDADRVRCVLMSPEGMSLFDASQEAGRIKVHRALPPLDNKGFASGLFRDVRLMFARPHASGVQVGRLEDGRQVCRWQEKERIREIILECDGGWWLRGYDQDGSVRQEVRACPQLSRGFSRVIHLSRSGALGYSMRLELLEAQPRP